MLFAPMAKILHFQCEGAVLFLPSFQMPTHIPRILDAFCISKIKFHCNNCCLQLLFNFKWKSFPFFAILALLFLTFPWLSCIFSSLASFPLFFFVCVLPFILPCLVIYSLFPLPVQTHTSAHVFPFCLL